MHCWWLRTSYVSALTKKWYDYLGNKIIYFLKPRFYRILFLKDACTVPCGSNNTLHNMSFQICCSFWNCLILRLNRPKESWQILKHTVQAWLHVACCLLAPCHTGLYNGDTLPHVFTYWNTGPAQMAAQLFLRILVHVSVCIAFCLGSESVIEWMYGTVLYRVIFVLARFLQALIVSSRCPGVWVMNTQCALVMTSLITLALLACQHMCHVTLFQMNYLLWL